MTDAPAATKKELPRPATGLPSRRRLGGLALAVFGLPVCTVVLTSLRSTFSLPSDLLIYLLVVVLIAVVGGVLPAVLGALAASMLVNYWFTPPFHSFTIAQRDHLLALIVFLVVAVTVSVAVDLAARLRSQSARSSAEAATLSRLASGAPADQSLPGVLEQVRITFGMASVALLQRAGAGAWLPVQVVGAEHPWTEGGGEIIQEAGPDLLLVGSGPTVFAEDRRVLEAYAAAAARALETQRLGEQAARARELAAVDRLRAALLAAVGHDLRTPLSGIKAAVSSLRQDDVEWSPEESAELLATIEESADQLDDLVANLLDTSRLRAGVLSVELRSVALDEVVSAVLLRLASGRVEASVSDALPLVRADPGLLERAVANLVANALHFSPAGRPVRITATAERDAVLLAVSDDGPGVAVADREAMFAPFQRLGDRGGGGVGLGLAISRGFTEAMGGTLAPSDSPGGGLTMTLSLPAAG